MSDTSLRAPRSAVILYAAVERNGSTTECRVRNLSSTGACVDNTAKLVPGERVRVEMGAIHGLMAEVKWVERTFAGLHFDTPVDLAAARQSRGKGVAPRAGWMTEMKSAYRRSA